MIPTIEPYEKYGECMGGCDLHDFYRMARYCMQYTVNFRKWYCNAFAATMDMVIVNSFILWKMSKPKSKQMTHGEFLEQLSHDMVNFIAPVQIEGRMTRALSTPNQVRMTNRTSQSESVYDRSLHSICILSPGKGYAGAHRNQKRCSLPGCKCSTWHYCEACGLCFCVQIGNNLNDARNCFDLAHSDEGIWSKIQQKVHRKVLKHRQMSETERRKEAWDRLKTAQKRTSKAKLAMTAQCSDIKTRLTYM